MRAGKLAVLSAAFASACCGLPLLLVAVGLGSLGFGSFLGKYHWYFTGIGVALLAAAWFVFLREKRHLYAAGIEMRSARFTSAMLGIATLAVVGFLALNVYSALGLGSKAQELAHAASGEPAQAAQVVLPVQGMTCFSCEVAVEKALNALEGVVEAKASASEHKVLVRYEPGRVTFRQMVEAIDATGFEASPPGS